LLTTAVTGLETAVNDNRY